MLPHFHDHTSQYGLQPLRGRRNAFVIFTSSSTYAFQSICSIDGSVAFGISLNRVQAIR